MIKKYTEKVPTSESEFENSPRMHKKLEDNQEIPAMPHFGMTIAYADNCVPQHAPTCLLIEPSLVIQI